MAIFSEFCNLVTSKQLSGAERIAKEIENALLKDKQKRIDAISNWDGIGAIPVKIPVRYVLDLNERALFVVYAFRDVEERENVVKFPDVELAAFAKAISKYGWRYDQTATGSFQYVRE